VVAGLPPMQCGVGGGRVQPLSLLLLPVGLLQAMQV
jgi:hypothetical protein